MSGSLTQISAGVGFLLPLVIAWIKREKWSRPLQTVFATAACALAAVITTYFQGKFNIHDLSTSVITIFLMTKTSYMAVWKPTGVADGMSKTTG